MLSRPGLPISQEVAALGHAAVIRELVAHGVDPNANRADGKSVLQLACEGGHRDAVAALLELKVPAIRLSYFLLESAWSVREPCPLTKANPTGAYCATKAFLLPFWSSGKIGLPGDGRPPAGGGGHGRPRPRRGVPPEEDRRLGMHLTGPRMSVSCSQLWDLLSLVVDNVKVQYRCKYYQFNQFLLIWTGYSKIPEFT